MVAPLSAVDPVQIRYFSSNDKKKATFRPRRRQSPDYRPLKPFPRKKDSWFRGNQHKFVNLADNDDDSAEAILGPVGADVVRQLKNDHNDPEEELRLADYMLAEHGSTEELVAERRAVARAFDTQEERETFLEDLDELLRDTKRMYQDPFEEEDHLQPFKGQKKIAPAMATFLERLREENEVDEDEDPDTRLLPNQLAHGEWSEMLVTVDRNVKLWRGGRLDSYRALVIGGNMNGCAGFGIGKAKDPIHAVDLAGRRCKRNIFFVDRYQGDGITGDLVGKQNSCTVQIRATDNGLRGNPLCREILKRFGIANAVAKAHGTRSPWNVVRATFKALLTHESIEDISLKRGKRLVSLDRAMRMQV